MSARRALALLVVAGCGRAGPRDVVANRGGAPTADADAWSCPAGDAIALDLDGDGRDDRVRLAPSAASVTCLEVHASTAPTLVCDAARPQPLAQLEREDGRYRATGTAPCDPMGARVRSIAAPAGTPAGPRSERALLADAAPTGTALWLDGGDASAAITWHGHRWAWVAIGY